MVYKKYGTKPVNNLVRKGIANGKSAPSIEEFRVEVAANMYPGRLVQTGTTEDDIKVGDALHAPLGWLGYEDSDPISRPATVTDIYAVNARAMALSGGGFMPVGFLAKGCICKFGDDVAGWTDGTLIGPVLAATGGVVIGIPFTKSTAEVSTSIVLPAGLMVGTPWIDVSTAVAGSSIEVGLAEVTGAEAGGDGDGFLDGISCAATGPVYPSLTTATPTLGALLVEDVLADAATPSVPFVSPKMHKTDGVAKTVTYKTSNHTVAGKIWIPLYGPGLKIVGQVQENIDASAAITRAFVQSEL